MAYATMMVYSDIDARLDDHTRLALELANQFEATLIGISAVAVPPIVVDGLAVDAQLTEEEYKSLQSSLDNAGAKFRQLATGARKPVEWRAAIEPPTDFVARQARSADLIIVGRDQLSVNLYTSLDPAGLILRAGRPVLVVPKGKQSMERKSVLVLWKDTREARRALQDSLPLLHEAENVFVVEVCETGSEKQSHDRLIDVTQYLARHRIKATSETIMHSELAVGGSLIQFAEKHQVGLIVAGAYGHSRLGEWIFGGVTRELMKTSPICCLLSH